MERQAKQQASHNRKHLSNVRVIQRNLVYVIGLPLSCAKEEVPLKHQTPSRLSHAHTNTHTHLPALPSGLSRANSTARSSSGHERATDWVSC